MEDKALMLDNKLLVVDPHAWYEAYLDTPMGIAKGLSETQAFKTPGCCVKTFQMAPPGRPVMTGQARVTQHGAGRCDRTWPR